MKAPRAVARLGDDLLGDMVNLYTGTLEFAQQEVLPHIHGVYSSSKGWDASANLRCQNFGPPSPVQSSGPTATWNATEFWHGHFLYVPGQGDMELLPPNLLTNPRTGKPSNDNFPNYANDPSAATTYKAVTTAFWALKCIPLAVGTGDGFEAHAPDGSVYTFDRMVRRPATRIVKSSTQPSTLGAADPADSPQPAPEAEEPGDPQAASSPYLDRVEVWLLPSKVTDKYNNVVTYFYDTADPWKLTSIVSSENNGEHRTLNLTWQPTVISGGATRNLIKTVTDGYRTWTYDYTSGTGILATVTLPDRSAWQLSGLAALQQELEYAEGGAPACDSPGNVLNSPISASASHPSGATGTFGLTPTVHGRSRVQSSGQCLMTGDGNTYPVYPIYFHTLSLTSKSIQGAGLRPAAECSGPTCALQWQTTYSPAVGSLDTCTVNCGDSKTVSVVDPQGNATVTTFGTIAFNGVVPSTEGQLLQTDTYDHGNLLRTTYYAYLTDAEADNYNVPVPVGRSLQPRGDGATAARLHPMKARTIRQQGKDFEWSVATFDTRARPLAVHKSDGTSSRDEVTAYYDVNDSTWVLGNIDTVTVNGNMVIDNFGYNAKGDVISHSKFGKLVEARTIDSYGMVRGRQDGDANWTYYDDYFRGVPRLIRYPVVIGGVAMKETAAVNGIGQVTSLTNPAGSTFGLGYDAIGRLARIDYPAADTIAWNPVIISYAQYTNTQAADFGVPAPHWRQIIDVGNKRTITVYDAFWRPVVTRTSDRTRDGATLRATVAQFDHRGLATFSSYPAATEPNWANPSAGTFVAYDALGRETQRDAAYEQPGQWLTTRTNYLSGFQKQVVNPRGMATTLSFQTFDEPSEENPLAIAMPEGVATSIQRDVFGKPLAITRTGPGNGGTVSATRRYVYDANQILCKQIDPETLATVMAVDGANNLQWKAVGQNLTGTGSCDLASVPEADKVYFTYDELNRLKNTQVPAGTTLIGRNYTIDGLIDRVTSMGSTWTNSYNKRRLLERESLVTGGVTYNLDRTYDANGSLSVMGYPDGARVGFAPDALGQPTNICVLSGATCSQTLASGILHHPNGAIKSFQYGNGVIHSTQLNARLLPRTRDDSAILSSTYDYDANGNPTHITDNLDASYSRGMGYDDLDRLTSVTAPLWGTASYGYDGLDNMVTSALTNPGYAFRRTDTHLYDYTRNRLTGISSNLPEANLGYQYDARGNVKQRGSAGLGFDILNRLRTGTYAYDAYGHRFNTVINGTSSYQVYSQEGKLYYGGVSGTVGSKYVYLDDRLIAEVRPNFIQSIHTDELGSPIATASYDPATRGQVLQRSRYEPYGKVAQYDTQTFGFTGHVNAADVGLVYMQQRYYDPLAARFLSVDPVTNANFGSSFNRYNYASNSPYKYIDPDGRATVTAEACLVACAGVTLGYSKGEIALTINAGLGLGGGLSIDPRSGENGRSNYVNPDAKGGKYGGVAVDAYNKVGVEIGVLEKGFAVGAKLSGGRDLTSGEHVGGPSVELGGVRKTGVGATIQTGAEISVYVKPGAVLNEAAELLSAAGKATSTKAKEILDAAKNLAQPKKFD